MLVVLIIDHSLRRLSVPKTKYTVDRAVNLPKKAITYVKQVIGEMFPELTVSLPPGDMHETG